MTETRRSRGGGRAGHAAGQGTQAIRQMPWRIPLNPDAPPSRYAEGVAAIHDAAMRVLEEVGIEFLNEEAKSTSATPAAPSTPARTTSAWTAASSWSRSPRPRASST